MISCLIVSHNKPEYVQSAISSLLNQRYQNWEGIIMDSGVLYDNGYFSWVRDPRMKIIRSTETAETRKTKAMAPWCFNQCLRNLARGDLITYLCDDDIWYENAFEVFANYKEDHPEVEAMYASQDTAVIEDNVYLGAERRALVLRGKGGQKLDCEVDYLQFCHTLSIQKKLNVFWPEDKYCETHADGVFMDRIGKYIPIYPIDIKIGQNRRTPVSTYKPHETRIVRY